MKVKIDFKLNRRFGVVERLIFRLVLNGFTNAREIRLSLPIFSDAVIANAIRSLVNEQILSADVESGSLSLSDAMVAIIAMCNESNSEMNIPTAFIELAEQSGILIDDNRIPETIMLKDAIVRELLPNIKLDTFRYSLDFIIRPDKGE